MRRAFIACVGSLVAVAFACGEQLEPSADLPDRPGADGGEGGAGDAGEPEIPFDASAPCRLDLPFEEPVALASLNTGDNETLARVTADEKMVFYEVRSSGGGPSAFFMASRASRTDPFSSGQPVIGGMTGDGDPAISDDGLRLYFTSQARPDAAGYDIFVRTRGAIDASFGEAVKLGLPNGIDSDFQPYERAGGLWFTSARQSPTRDVWFAAGAGTAFGEATKLAVSASSPIDDQLPLPSADGLTLYFESSRPDGKLTHSEIYVARRARTTSAFNSPQKVEELSPPGFHTAPNALSVDGCRLYFHSSRNGSYDLFVAEKPAK